MEFMSTYAWMALILIIVLAALAYLGMFNEPKPTMCSFPGNFVCRAVKLTTDGNLTLDLYQNTGHDITVLGVNCTQNSNGGAFLAAANIPINDSDHNLIANGMNVQCLDPYGVVATGSINMHYTGKVLVYYIENDTGVSHLISGDLTVTYE